ncbi:MAG: lysine--tRNA ligase [Patescibacteria group bacterium]
MPEDKKHLDEYDVRLKKLENIKKAGINPYPASFDKQNSVIEIQTLDNGTILKTAGRLMTIREMGKIIFCHLQDESGKAQVALKQDDLDKDQFKFFLKNIDMGDFIGIEGEIFTTQKGEKTLLVKEYTFLGKALLPLPEKWHGIKDEELRYRQRYLDLVSNRETMNRFNFRSNFIKYLREFYWQEGFKEVETQTLMHSPTGASAKPYITHNNGLDIDVFLRISLELPLKELIVGGYEKVFEIGKVFRNEGFDPSHLPEHLSLEHYSAYWDFEDNMKFTEKMFNFLSEKLDLDKKVNILGKDGTNKEVDFTTPWQRKNFIEMVKEDSGIDIEKIKDVKELKKLIKEKNIEIEDIDILGYGSLVDALYKKLSRPKLVGPVFLYNYPVELQPLARRNDQDPAKVDQFQLVVNGWEIIKAYSELVDPLDQEQRFKEQAEVAMGGDEEAQVGDDDYITAMKYGMPPISGWGMGIERIITLLTNQTNLRDVVFFPLMRPKDKEVQQNNKELDLAIDLKAAQELVDKHIVDNVTKLHLIESQAIMQGLARHFGEDEEKWGILGLLHDIDWDLTKDDVKQHCIKAVEILKQAGVSEQAINIIQAHCYGQGSDSFVGPEELKDKKRAQRVEHALAIAETLTGLIIASALMQPDKKLASVKLSSLKKKFKNKSFAANCNREIMMECEKIGLSLDKFLEIGLTSIQNISDKLGL